MIIEKKLEVPFLLHFLKMCFKRILSGVQSYEWRAPECPHHARVLGVWGDQGDLGNQSFKSRGIYCSFSQDKIHGEENTGLGEKDSRPAEKIQRKKKERTEKKRKRKNKETRPSRPTMRP